MIAIDTNVLVRLLVNDDQKQVAAAMRSIEGAQPVLLLNTVLQECVWVLESLYESTRADIADALAALVRIPVIVLEGAEVTSAIEWYRNGMDFADAMHLAAAAGRCERLLTFDAGFVRKAKGKSVCAVQRPE